MRLNDRNPANARQETPSTLQVRSGFSLSEVLIAIFVLAIGMMGILALFPLGAAQMAQAIKDERSGQLADISEAHMRILWRQAWLVPYSTANPTNANVGTLDSEVNMIGRCPEYTFDFGNTSAASTGPGQPIYLDPIGYPVQPSKTLAGSGVIQRVTLGIAPGSGSVGVSQTSMWAQGAASLGQRIRLFGLIDDLTFQQNGEAAVPVNRADRYNAAFLLQRPKNNVRQEVNLKVVVYQGRSPDIASAEVTLPRLSSPLVPGSDSLSVSTDGTPLRLNSWVLVWGTTPVPFADFYRVVGYTSSQISVSPQIRAHGNVSSYTGTAAILTDVIEVFDRGTITPFEVAGQ
jgi:prepilin-type N-terminal cleavage/methylation domain-containing protein